MNTFTAYLATKTEQGQVITKTDITEDDLMEGDVTVKVEYSALNYKDGLAMTNSAPIIRQYPLVPGIDFAGTVISSDSDRFQPGDRVVLNGFGVGESHSGGFASFARVKSEWLVPLPVTISTRQAMAIGTAGYTAMLCIMALQHHGIKPEQGNILVTGAAGGVGSVAVSVLKKLGYSVSATTGRLKESDYLKNLGAIEILDRNEFSGKPKPLAKEHWAAAIDVAGGNTLANVLSQIKRGGAVAACGLAESMDLPTSVAPFILRGVTLYGIDSVMCPMQKRLEAWQRLDTDLDKSLLESLSTEIDFDDLPEAAEAILKGQIRGRTIVKIPQ
jgi:acrylyl-CoA reductase (NADPH)